MNETDEQERISREECAVILRELGDEAWSISFNPYRLKRGDGIALVELCRRIDAEIADGTLKPVSCEELFHDLGN